jgi:hypothetical protein
VLEEFVPSLVVSTGSPK